jgi:hypothetical protein
MAGVACPRPVPGAVDLKVYQFPDADRLRDFHEIRSGEVRPALRRTPQACQAGRPGLTTWTHGLVACWTPAGRQRSVLHWTDERTNTYAIVQTLVEDNARLGSIWRSLRTPPS